MRMEPAGPGAEPEETLSKDWPLVLRRALGGVRWLPIPNLGREVGRFLRPFGVGAVILTGGNDVGACPERDRTERSLVEDCIRARRPILGVCRGLQVLQDYFGGRLREAPHAHDRGRTHPIRVCHDRGRRLLGRERFSAPSYHRFGVAVAELAPELEAWAVSDDGFVEGLHHPELPIVAVQWHPERPLAEDDVALSLLRSFADGWPG